MPHDLTFSNMHQDLAARDEDYVLGWRFEPRIIFERGAGTQLFDVDGNAYYDMSSGMMSLTLGHAHPELVDTIKSMADRFTHQSSWYSNPWAIEFAELLATTLPGELKMTNFAVTGSEANEIAMRMALGATGRFDICSMVRGLHGGSLAAESVTSVGGARRRGLGPLTMPARSNCIVPAFYYRAPVDDPDQWDEISLQMTEDLIEYTTSQEVAALMLEPIAVPGGMIVPSERWLRGIREIANKWDALLVFDECQLAPARTGKFWAFEHFGVVPDIVSFGKGLTAGFANCGTVTTPEIAEKTRGTKGLPWAGTYPQDPLPCAVGLTQLKVVLRDNLVEKAATEGEFVGKRLKEVQDKHECVGDVRGMGLYRMLDIVADRKSKEPDAEMAERIRYHALEEGLLLIVVKNYVRFCPPLIASHEELDDMVGRLDAAIVKAKLGLDIGTNLSASGSLATNNIAR
ncbi:MAG: aspartate aminotransferase family protein [Pseudomonadota bacterium]|nr:aspartate aminotransferase family protein [Pseudomonadota bacterium]